MEQARDAFPRFNHLMILNLNKDKLDALDLDVICSEFVAENEQGLSLFGQFELKYFN